MSATTRYGDWHIAPATVSYMASTDWAFWHDDYDGAPDGNDHRCGHGASIEHCKSQIDEYEAASPATQTDGER